MNTATAWKSKRIFYVQSLWMSNNYTDKNVTWVGYHLSRLFVQLYCKLWRNTLFAWFFEWVLLRKCSQMKLTAILLSYILEDNCHLVCRHYFIEWTEPWLAFHSYYILRVTSGVATKEEWVVSLCGSILIFSDLFMWVKRTRLLINSWSLIDRYDSLK